jgi:hypothetical protein
MVNWIVCNLGSRPIIFTSDDEFIAFCNSIVGKDDTLNLITRLSKVGIHVLRSETTVEVFS